MILLISQDSLEATTIDVDNWLQCLNADYLRINGSDLIQMQHSSIAINNTNTSVKFILNDGVELDLDKVNIVWFRRWQHYPHFPMVTATCDAGFEETLNHFRVSEFKALSNIFYSLIKDKVLIGTPSHLNRAPIKFEQLRAARQCGFLIPKTLLTGNKDELIAFYNDCDKKVITKSTGESTGISLDNIEYGIFTSLVNDEVIDSMPGTFFPSLFQQAIEKEAELRVFYLNKKSYAMAIFSSSDKQTEVDFRVYNWDRPNRNVPFQLPEDIKNKVELFMESVGLVTGSLDIILTKNNEFVFLEVNPVGQFGMVSFPCNYYLEKVVAEELIGLDR